VILSVGVKVENKLATAAGAKLGVRGSVVVDDTMRTTVPWLWAVGDMIETRNFITGAPVNLALAVSSVSPTGTLYPVSYSDLAHVDRALRTSKAALQRSPLR
jgi:pyruvate/2-oxoglutarate dehydrogenase complex dihydrolipoamide dehydrogenase (E3) component